jgi:integrase
MRSPTQPVKQRHHQRRSISDDEIERLLNAPVSGDEFERLERLLARSPSALTAEHAVAITHWTLHDLRRSVASGLARIGINLPVVEKILGHTSGTFRGVVGIYQRFDFAGERRTALEALGNFVTALIGEQARKQGCPFA